MNRRNACAFLTAVALCTGSIQAQQVPVRELRAVEAASDQRFGLILNVRVLPDGRAFVNDGTNLKVWLLDSLLANPIVVIGDEVQSYGNRAAPILPYLDDSTIFVDRTARSLVLIDARGKIARVFAPPRAADILSFANAPSGVDAQGNLVYIGPCDCRLSGPNGELIPPTAAHNAPIVRSSFVTRALDTIAFLKVRPPFTATEVSSVNGKRTLRSVDNPWLEVDDWVVLSDGTVAVIRGHDYRVEFFRAGKLSVLGPRMPFDARRLSEDDKRRLVDSAKSVSAENLRKLRASSPTSNVIEVDYIDPSKIGDYLPSIRPATAKPDADGNLWLLPFSTANSIAGELVYDVADGNGRMIYRVRLPVGKSIAGFGRGGIIYLMSKDEAGWKLERTRLK